MLKKIPFKKAPIKKIQFENDNTVIIFKMKHIHVENVKIIRLENN